MGSQPAQRTAALGDDVARLADALVDLEYDPHAQSLAGDPGFVGRTADLVGAAAEAFDRLWPAWSQLKDAAEQARAALERGDDAGAAAALDLASRPVEDVVAQVDGDLRRVCEAADVLRRAREEVLPQVAGLTGRLGTLEEHAATLGAADHPAVVDARRTVREAIARMGDDPVAVDGAAVVAAVEAAEAAVRDLAAERESLTDRLASARAVCDDLARLIDQGRTALRDGRDKVAGVGGRLEPLAPGVVDGDDPRALRPWLERIAAAHERGDWRAATAGLAAWRRVADGALAHAHRVLAANAAPLRRRDELRGLLDALRAKAVARGLAEDLEVAQGYDAAREVLWVAPCPLPLAERRVADYRRLVNDRIAAAEEASP